MFQLLGADLYQHSPKVSLDIKNCLGVPVFVTLDACHLIKLVRNAFGDLKEFISPDGSLIKWQYLVHLNNLQCEKKLHLSTKIRAAHIDYTSNRMKVCLATQTISKSGAKALTLCDKVLKLPLFNGSSATSEFLIMFNDIFDWLNSKKNKGSDCGSEVRLPISRETFSKFSEFFATAKSYICSLKHVDGKYVIDGKRKQAFLGLICTMKSFVYIYRCYVQTRQMKYILTYKYSQDHLEHFFGMIRQSLGCNNNPTTIQVKWFRFCLKLRLEEH